MSQLVKNIICGLVAGVLLPMAAFAQIGGTGWKTQTVSFNVQKPYNIDVSLRYWFTNNIYHCMVFSNDASFNNGTTRPRTEMRFNPDFTGGEIQYQAVMMVPGNENSYCIWQDHTGDAQSPTYGPVAIMLIWLTKDGGSIWNGYSGKEVAKNLANQWFQLNVDHNVFTHTIRVWINRQLLVTEQDVGATDYYFKTGVYEQDLGTPTLQMDTYVTNSVQEWVNSGTNPPAAPMGLTATPTATQIPLVWNSSVAATNYNLKRSITTGTGYTTIASLAGTSYTDTNVTVGTPYYYVVTAVDQFGESSNSTQVATSLFNAGFQLAATPATIAVTAGNSTNYTVAMTTNSTFSGTTTLGVAGLPTGVSANFVPASLNAAGNSTLTIQTTTNAPGGAYALTITGTNGASIYVTTANLVVTGIAANAGPLVWTPGGTDTNWSTIQNWINIAAGGFGPPGTNNNVIFTNAGSGTVLGTADNLVDESMSVLSLQYSQTNNYHTTQIAGGQTLTVGTNLTAGSGTDLGANGVLAAAMIGSGGTLAMTNTNSVITVRQGTAANAPGATNSLPLPPWLQRATLDLSGLGTFNASLGRVLIAGDGGSSAYNSREVGTVYLAQTNSISAFGAAPQIDVGENGSNGAGANAAPTNLTSYLYLGMSNAIYVDSIAVGRAKSAGVLTFNPAFTNNQGSSLYLRGAGSTAVGTMSIGDESLLGASNQRSSGLVDLEGGALDAMINVLYVGRSMNGNNNGSAVCATGTLAFNLGTVNVNTVEVGYQTLATGTGPGCAGTINVNGAGKLVINQVLELGHGNVSLPLEQGTLNISDGTVLVTNIVGGGGVSTINVNSGLLDLQGTNATPGTIANVSTLNVGTNGASDPALVANASLINVSNIIMVAANGTLAGNTAIASPGVTINGTIAPGVNGTGSITNNGQMVFGAGGTFDVKVQNVNGVPGAGWDLLQAGGALNIQSSGANPFIIQLESFNPNGSGMVTNFNNSTNYDWVIATATGGIANFAAANFTVDASLFANDLAGGYFYVRMMGNSLILSFTNNHPPVAGVAWFYRTGTTMAIPISTLASQWSDPDGDPVALLSVNGSTNGAALGDDNNFVYYTNANNVADEILYTVEDIRTNPPAAYRPGDTQQTGMGEIILLPPPAIGNATMNAGGLSISGSGGISNGVVYVLSSTNVALPAAQWTCIATNAFDSSGNFGLTNPVDPTQPQTFFLLKLQ